MTERRPSLIYDREAKSTEQGDSQKIFGRNRLKQYAPKAIGALAAAGAIFAAVHFGPKTIEELTTDPSAVVAGVPGLVINNYANHVWTGKFYMWKYWLSVEQCPRDISAAQYEDRITQSFNPDPSAITPGCFADWVAVSGNTYGQFGIGSIISFEGEPTEHLRK